MPRQIKNILFLVLLGFLLISLYKSVRLALLSNQRLNEARISLDRENEEFQKLANKLEEAKSLEYVESVARNEFGLGREGELVLRLPDDQKVRELAPNSIFEEEKPPIKPYWRQWLELFF